MLELSLVIMVAIAVLTLQTQRLRNAVIYMGVLSLVSSFVYLLYGAPDVAIAEAVVGSTLATVLYLVALQKYKLFTIFIKLPASNAPQALNAHGSNRGRGLWDPRHWDPQMIKHLEVFCAKQELEPQFILTTESLESILSKRQYALIIDATEDKLRFIGHPENYKIQYLEAYLKNYAHRRALDFVAVHESYDGWEAQS